MNRRLVVQAIFLLPAAVTPFQKSGHFLSHPRGFRTESARATESAQVTNQETSSSASKSVTLNTPAERAEYASRAKARLLELIPELSDDPEGHERVGLLISGLATVQGYQPIMTAGFLDLCMAGEWKLVYTTSPRRSGSLRLRLTELVQVVEPDSLNNVEANVRTDEGGGTTIPSGRVRSVAAWDWAGEASGRFEVQSTYEMDTKGGMVMPPNDPDYMLEPTRGELTDPMPLCASLEAAMPPELFGPHVFALQRNVYLDAEMRIVEYQKEDGMGARGVFVRTGKLPVE